MKKVVLTLVAIVLGIATYAQESANTPQVLKYITTGPDGSVAMMVSDDISKDNMKLESADNFYKFEIIEPSTHEAVYTSANQGKACTIDKNKLAAGTYDLRLYTSSFVITSKITVTAARKMRLPSQLKGDVVATRQ